MYTRENLKQDLNALANSVSREEDLMGIQEELNILVEEIEGMLQEENKDAVKGKTPGEDSRKTTADSPASG